MNSQSVARTTGMRIFLTLAFIVALFAATKCIAQNLQTGISVTLPIVGNAAAFPDADKEDALLVAVTRDDKVFFGTDVVKPDDLTEKIKDKLANRTDKRVFLKADMRAKFGWVVEVVDDVRAAGVDQLGLLTDQKKAGTIAPPPGATTPTPTGGQ